MPKLTKYFSRTRQESGEGAGTGHSTSPGGQTWQTAGGLRSGRGHWTQGEVAAVAWRGLILE